MTFGRGVRCPARENGFMIFNPMGAAKMRIRALEHPATQDGGLLTDRDPGGTAGSDPEDTHLGNPDIWIPVTEMTTVHPCRAEEDARNQEEEDDTGDPKRETDARREEKTEAETGETRERQGEEHHVERSYLEAADS
ncbi:hypothetical protein NDU88_002948 [Pleurodeles waltl]|uniref:Uncharacterized protein n=1 Tax=Pleurodeles waltl TaxID=8319 RepID=A0AAV7L2Q4_PLEWA|nr:hypothetical protein NDU88_002948 [Pleurodeles waltl]